MSSSATTDDQGGRARPAVAHHRHAGAVLVLAGVLSVLLIVAGVLLVLDKVSPPPKTAPVSNLVGFRLSAATFPHRRLVDAPGTLVVPWAHHHGTVLLFFANWCPPCHDELHQLGHSLGNGHLGSVRVVGVDGDISASVAASFVAANRVRFPVAHDPTSMVASGLQLGGFPAAVLVGPTGKIVAVQHDAMTATQLRAWISKIGRATPDQDRDRSSGP
jgi:thiol-disulfide isomerase/thioredoxin